MKYVVDNDLHIHSGLSSCSRDLQQNPERILQYALECGLKTICVTDHFWDDAVEGASSWYMPQNYEHISSAKPLPQAEKVKFLFGCETELNQTLTLGIAKEKFDLFDFIIIPTTHFHMVDFTVSKDEVATLQKRAEMWVKRFACVLNMDLPFHKIGIAHLTCSAIAPTREKYLEVLKLIPEAEMERLFLKAAQLGVGIELNYDDMNFADGEAEVIARPYKIAKRCGCKFYCGSDAHTPAVFENAKKIFERAVDLLSLTEADKFIVGSCLE